MAEISQVGQKKLSAIARSDLCGDRVTLTPKGGDRERA
jgi:hypothetical protein